MSGQATSELYAVVDLSKKKTKKTVSNQDGDTSDQEVKMHDVLNRKHLKDNMDLKNNEPHSSKEKSKICKVISF